jgi:hypothetical protein
MVSASERQKLVEGIGAAAVTLAEMGESEGEARSRLVALLNQVGVTDAEIVRDAAAAIGTFPQPIDETLEEIERARPIRESLGVPSAEYELEAALRAREWLQRLAADLG